MGNMTHTIGLYWRMAYVYTFELPHGWSYENFIGSKTIDGNRYQYKLDTVFEQSVHIFHT